MKHILKCLSCNKYTMKESCCGVKTENPKPVRYSPADKYAKYRRQAKKQRSKRNIRVGF